MMDRKTGNYLRKPHNDDQSGEQAAGQRTPPPVDGSVVDREAPGDDRIARRERRAAESILDDERLTDALDDNAAKSLIDWGLAAAKRLALNTAGLADDDADHVLENGMQATRRMMRYANMLAAGAGQMDAEKRQQLVTKIAEQARAVYSNPVLPDLEESPDGVLHQPAENPNSLSQLTLDGDPADVIARLRAVFEPPETPAGEAQPAPRQPYQADLDNRSGASANQEDGIDPSVRLNRRLPGQSKVDSME